MEESEQPAEPRYGWVMVAVAAVCIGMGNGAITSISVFLKPLITENGWLRGETTFAYFAAMAAFGVGGIVIGYLADRYPARRFVLIGAISVAVSYLLLSQATALWEFYLIYCLMGGFGAGAFFATLMPNAGSWFNANKGLAIGLVSAGQAAGNGLVGFVGRKLITEMGWRDTYWTLGIVSLVTLVPLALLVKEPPGREYVNKKPSQQAAIDEESAYPIPPGPLLVWLSVFSVLIFFGMAPAMVHTVALAQDIGFGPTSAASILLLLYLSNIAARIGFGVLSDRIGVDRAMWIAVASVAATSFWFSQLESLAGFYILAVVFGLLNGVPACINVYARAAFPIQKRGFAMGILILTGFGGIGLGAYLAGLLFDLTGSYTVPFAVGALSSTGALIVISAIILRASKLRARSSVVAEFS